MFRVYKVGHLWVNGTQFHKVWIDPHYEVKHQGSINDELILSLVGLLDRQLPFLPKKVRADGFEFFESDLVWKGKHYRLIWIIPPDRDYLGVRNAYRRSP